MFKNIALLCIGAQASLVQREPLLTWEPSAKKGFKKNYFIPNFGADGDMADSQDSLDLGEKIVGHHW